MQILSKRRNYIQDLLELSLAEAGIPADQTKGFIDRCLLHMRQMEDTYLPDKIFNITRRIKHLSHVHGITTEQATDALMEDPARLFKDGAPILRKEDPAPAVAQETAESMPEKPAAPSSATNQKTSILEFEIAALLLGGSITGRSAGSAEKSPPDTDTTYTPLQKRYLHPSAR